MGDSYIFLKKRKMRIKRETGSAGSVIGRLGKIKVGERDARGFPKSLDHFRFTSEYKELEKMMNQNFGKNEVNVVFHSDDPGEVCREFYELRDNAGKLVAIGDGDEFEVYGAAGAKKWTVGTTHKTMVDMKKDLATLVQSLGTPKYTAKFRTCALLRIVVIGCPDLGYWELRTYGEKTSIRELIGVFDTALHAFGTISRIPFRLRVTMAQSNTAGPARRYPVISLFPTIGYDQADKVLGAAAGIHGLITAEKLNQPALAAINETGVQEDQPDEYAEYVDVSGIEIEKVVEGLEQIFDIDSLELYFKQTEEFRNIPEIVELFEKRRNELKK